MSGWAPTVGYVVQNQLNNLLSLPPDTTGARELIKALLLTLIKERAAESAELQGVGDYTVLIASKVDGSSSRKSGSKSSSSAGQSQNEAFKFTHLVNFMQNEWLAGTSQNFIPMNASKNFVSTVRHGLITTVPYSLPRVLHLSPCYSVTRYSGAHMYFDWMVTSTA